MPVCSLPFEEFCFIGDLLMTARPLCLQSERVQFDEQARMKDVELNRLKSVRIELEQGLRDSSLTIDRVSRS